MPKRVSQDASSLRDEHENLRGELKIEARKPIFELYNESGKVIWSTEPSLREVH